MYQIKLYKNIDSERTYDNVRWFSSIQNQKSYFSNKKHITIDECTPNIAKEFSFLCKGNVENYREYSYMSFQDTSVNNSKIIYCFIDEVFYKNQNTFIINYSIDVFQTYMFQIEFTKCFVEREHVLDDTVGLNTIDEGLGIDELVCNREEEILTTINFYIVVNSTVNLLNTDESVSSGIYNGIMSSGKWYAYENNSSDIAILKSNLNNVIEKGKGDGIISIFMLPTDIINVSGHVVQESYFPISSTHSFNKQTNLDGYIPKNNKLLTYPYICIRVTNNTGQIVELRQERFSNKIEFIRWRAANSSITSMLIPTHYNGLVEDNRYTCSLEPFPVMQWTNNPYQTWLSQNSLSNLTSMILPGVMTGIATGNPLAGVGAGFASALNTMGAAYSYSQKPLESKGRQNVNILNSMSGYNQYEIQFYTLKAEIAKSIDDYFTRYGYKVNRYKVPNINTRTDFNFVKTSDCNFTGNIPKKYLDIIINAFNKGITLYHQDF